MDNPLRLPVAFGGCGCCKNNKPIAKELPNYGGVCADCLHTITGRIAGVRPEAYYEGIGVIPSHKAGRYQY